MDDIEGERGLSRAGKPGDDDKLVLGNIKVYIFEVVQARISNRDHGSHGVSRVVSYCRGGKMVPVDWWVLFSQMDRSWACTHFHFTTLVCKGRVLKLAIPRIKLSDHDTLKIEIGGAPVQFVASLRTVC